MHRYLIRPLTTIVVSIFISLTAHADPVTVTPNGVQDQRDGRYAFTHATIQVDENTQISDGTLLIKRGRIEKVGRNLRVPQGYTTFDLNGRYIYPGLIELDSDYGLPPADEKTAYSWSAAEVTESQTAGAYNANEAIKSAYRAAAHFSGNEEQAKSLRELGFSTVLSHRKDGLARGTSALVQLAEQSDHENIIKADAAAHYSFDKGSSAQTYPRSPMGFVALLRQTYLDAQWYSKLKPKDFVDQSLIAWNASQKLPQIFDASENWQSLLRADRVGDEFKTQYIIRSAGDSYQRIKRIKATGASLIVPVDFPIAMDVGDPLLTDQISLADMKHWELAPTNPARLASQGIRFALTSSTNSADKKITEDFWKNIRKTIDNGLDEADALAALTSVPAAMLGMKKDLGKIQTGGLANFLITSDALFAEHTVIEENWIAGIRHKLADHVPDLSGHYQLTVNDKQYPLKITREEGKYNAVLDRFAEESEQQKNPKVSFNFQSDKILISFVEQEGDDPIRLSGFKSPSGRQWSGRAQLGNGEWVHWNAKRTGAISGVPPDQQTNQPEMALGAVTYPFTAFGRTNMPGEQNLLLQNATVWTNEAEGILENADVLVKNGKIAAVGKNLKAGKANVYDATNMHITSGIIDEHSHIALSSVNDIATNSGMVRMSDVINSEDINIYRNLAGGVTAGQLLHGSANPIGGQSALVKYRWGATPEEMLIKGADKFIKFALGENVKRSANANSVRYPQTRMGVEQVYQDAFGQAIEYQQQGRNKRRDLALETMSEIINGERFITSHSYVQSEINMLMNVAEQYGFNINTFTHILEGYKVADRMQQHGAGGSTFADWWAYKWEVRYAIPYNAALMSQAGVTVAINSDSQEVSRRLNQEAAKSIKYGGMSEAEAWKMVTLNPAKLLHLDDRMGSIKRGKDADLVVWTENPLSIYAVADMTLVDGKILYSRQDDLKAREQVKNERMRLIAKLHAENQNGEKASIVNKPKPEWHCDSLHGYEHLNGDSE